jgi:hypothetical protein
MDIVTKVISSINSFIAVISTISYGVSRVVIHFKNHPESKFKILIRSIGISILMFIFVNFPPLMLFMIINNKNSIFYKYQNIIVLITMLVLFITIIFTFVCFLLKNGIKSNMLFL